MEDDGIDYKELYNNLERENISLRMYIIKARNGVSSFKSILKTIFSESDSINTMYGIGIFLTFILYPTLSFIMSLGKDNNEG